ncbi:MAG: DUF4097 domain-containing protein [Clostridiaceae bacterium]|nr:DUF4097 domain-containing protein [Clostridiaceae bacterium]
MKKLACITIVIVLSVFMLAGCRHFDSFEEVKMNNAISDDISIEGSKLDKLEINNGVGDIRVSKGTGEYIEIHYDKKIKYTNEDVEKVAEAILVDTKVSGGKLKVEVRSADANTQDLWKWLSDKFKGVNVSVDLTIKVPENMEDFEVTNGVGNVIIEDVDASIKVTSGVGNVTLRDIAMRDDCKINNGTGDINIEASADELSELKAMTGVGNIKVMLPEDTKLSIRATAGVGDIKGSLIDNSKKESFVVGGSLKQDINGGGADVKIETGTGKISIDKR